MYYNDFINKIKEKMPSRIYSHEADLDGFVSGNILYHISKYLFGESPKIKYINYDRLNNISADENEIIWVSDLNYNKSMDDKINGLMFIIDHHKWEPDPIDCTPDHPFCDKIYYIHDTTKSASLLCFELLKEIVNNSDDNSNKEYYQKYIEDIKNLVIQTNIGDIFKYNSTDELIEARSYARYFNDVIKPYLYCAETILNCKKEDLLPSFYKSYKKTKYYNKYKAELNQLLLLYEDELNKKQNEIHPGIYNIQYIKGDHSMIFNILLEKYKNIKAIITEIKNPNTYKWSLSIRSKDNKTAYHIASKYFNGGGHPNASGAVLEYYFDYHKYLSEHNEILFTLPDEDNGIYPQMIPSDKQKMYETENKEVWEFVNNKLKDYKDIE